MCLCANAFKQGLSSHGFVPAFAKARKLFLGNSTAEGKKAKKVVKMVRGYRAFTIFGPFGLSARNLYSLARVALHVAFGYLLRKQCSQRIRSRAYNEMARQRMGAFYLQMQG